MLKIDWDIKIEGQKRWRLRLVERITVKRSAVHLADTATVIIPEHILNRPVDIAGKLAYGDHIRIQGGYNGKLMNLFDGYITEIYQNGGQIRIYAEDAIFLFRKPVADKQFKQGRLRSVVEYVIQQIDPTYRLETDYDITWQNFVIRQASGYDVLKKIQEQTKAHIWFDKDGKTLYIRPPYLNKNPRRVKYDFTRNIDSANLEYRSNKDKKTEVIVEGTDANGRIHVVRAGTTGGDQVKIKVGRMSTASMQKLADTMLKNRQTDSYTGTFTGWLIPEVYPGDAVEIHDPDYPERTAYYYVETVETELSASGGKRKIKPGIKLQ